MCGIAGYYGKHPLQKERLEACQALMRRRGPDDEGFVSERTKQDRFLYLLHSRLSIIDLDDRARQPFENDGNYLSYNGEIYNYRELGSHLRDVGVRFSTSSDTEVLFEVLNRQGIHEIGSCEGMWAFAWFDGSKNKLYLCRDRFGEKPLYTYEDGDGIYFGSEPKFIFALLGKTLPINRSQIYRYLVNGYKSLYKHGDSFFEGLSEVEPGSYRSYGAEGRHDNFYWKPIFDCQKNSISYIEAIELARESLIKSVELRLRSDVPIAFCLSGGIDSNALVSIAKRKFDYDVHGFTIMNTDSRYEERDMVDVAVRELSLNHTTVPISTENFLDNLRSQIKYHDAPIYTITYYAQWELMKAISREGYKVSISGTGADELFSGYYDHHNAYLASMKLEDEERYQKALGEWSSVVAPYVRNPFLQDPDYFVGNPNAREHIYLDADYFSSILHEPFKESFIETSYSENLLRNRMANELRHESVPVILHEDDLNSMYYSIENRSPFLDKSLFEACQSIPTRHLVKGGCAKSVLRDAVRGLAPDAIIGNPRKVGFNAPLLDYLDIKDINVRDQLLDDSPIYNIINRNEIELMLQESQLQNSRSKFLFSFISAKIFLEEFAS